MSSGIYKVIVAFQDDTGKPLTGDDYSVAVLDKDRFLDDKLGESKLSADGEADFLITVADILSVDSAGETTPDLYFVVRKGGEEIFRSEVFANVNFETVDPVTGRSKSSTQSYGPFTVTES